MVLTTLPFDDRLDVADHIGQRVATFAWQLVDGVTDQILGDLTPLRDPVPTITHDTGQAIKRTINGIRFGVADTAAINPLTDRVRVYMVIGGVSWPLGRYTFTDATQFESTGGNVSNDMVVDEMFIIDQQIDRGFATTDNVTASVLDLITGLPIITPLIEASPYPGVGGWSAGTRRAQILDELSTQGDYFTPWMNNNGRFTMIRTFDPALAVPQFDWDAGNQVIRDTPMRNSDILTAPNRFVVVSNSAAAADAAIVGTYDVPPSAPHSIANRGFVIPSVVTVQLDDPAQAAAAAQNLGIRQTIFERVELATAPDPRHDSYDVVHWQGLNWLELAWSITCVEGAPMRHVIRRSYL
jgi:hypothetical protein